jgi:serine/threonine protein kinase
MRSVGAADGTPLPSQLGRYQIIETLGHGGMGDIQLAMVGGLGQFRKLVVLKVLRDQLANDARFVDMFMHEATLAARLNHPNVVQTIEAGQADGRYFMVMEFLDGQPLNKLLRSAQREPVVSLGLRLQVLSNALLGLHHAHELTDYDGRPLLLVHRDVSPSNVFITYDGQVKLLDFGIAESRDCEETSPGGFKGKLGYAAPEQLRGLPSDRRSDVFAAGVVLWETIALRPLSQRDHTRETFAARLAGSEPRIADAVPGIDPALAAICDRALENAPGERYQTALELHTALQDYLTSREMNCEPLEIGQLVRVKFARARMILHNIIDAAMRASVDDDSRVVAARPAAQPSIADPLGAEQTPSVQPLSGAFAPPPLQRLTSRARDRARMRRLGLGAAALAIIAVALAFTLRQRRAPQLVAVTPRPADPPAAPVDASPPLPFGLEAPLHEPVARRVAQKKKENAVAPVPAAVGAPEVSKPRVRAKPSEHPLPERPALDSLDLRDVRKEQRRAVDLVNPFL